MKYTKGLKVAMQSALGVTMSKISESDPGKGGLASYL